MARQEAEAAGAEKGAGVQSLVRAVSILDTVARSREGITLAELSKAVGLHTSTTFHLAKTLVSVAFLRQDPDTKRYRIGSHLFSLASGALDEIELLETARPVLAGLAEETSESSHVAVRSGDEVVIVGRIDGSASVRIAERVGAARPAYATAIGKVMLSALPAEKLDAYLAKTPLEPISAKTITDPEQLRAGLEEVRRTGIAFDDCEFDPEVRCLAGPVRDFTGQVVAAIGISGPVWRLSLTRISQVSDAVQSAARRLSSELGYVEEEAEAKAAIAS